MGHTLTRASALLALVLPLTLSAQSTPQTQRQPSGLSVQVEPMSKQHLAQITRFRTPPANGRLVSNGDQVLPLPARPMDFSGLRYQVEGQEYSLDDYMTKTHVGGLLVLQNGEALLERYGLGNDEDSVWISYSMAKSVTSLLYGAALADGYLSSLDAKVTDYLPAMKGSAYDGATLRHLLQMASGVQWNETYSDPNSDVGNYPGGNVVDLMQFLGAKPRVAAPGERFNYSTGETDLAGVVLRAAIGNNLSTYLTHKIWENMMESPAWWATHGYGGGERGGCCIYATLRDYGRLGLFVMNDGVLPDGTRVVPEGWIAESVAPSPASDGYGYFWWLEGDNIFRASGIYGQGIYFNPANDLVIVLLSAWTSASNSEFAAHRSAMFRAIDSRLAALTKPADVAAALAHPDRPAADAEADAVRKPAEVLAFAGLQRGMHILELEAGGGYYTEIMSRAVGSDGSVILHHAPGLMQYNDGGIERRTANNRLANVRVSLTNFDALDAADNSIDLVTWMQGPHELGFAPQGQTLGDPEASFREIARVLKPGGVFLAIDHIAPEGTGLEAGDTWHRVAESVTTAMAEAAGLTVLRRSELLMNADDPLNVSVFAPEVQGRTSQFMVLYQKQR